MAVPIPASVLRSLAVYGGCCKWAKLGDMVGASGSMLAVHTMRPGPRVIHLPAAATVVDAVSGAEVVRARGSFTVTLDAPQTRVFLFGAPETGQFE
jgi:hypothetical protein